MPDRYLPVLSVGAGWHVAPVWPGWGFRSRLVADASGAPVLGDQGTDRTAGLEGLRIQDLRHTAVALWIAAGAWTATATCTPSPMPPSATGWTPSTRRASATKTPLCWTYFRSARGPARPRNAVSAAGTRPTTL